MIILSLFHHNCSHIGRLHLCFWVECPGAQFTEFVTSPLDITHFETTVLLYFRELLRK